MADALPPLPFVEQCRKGHRIDVILSKRTYTQMCNRCGQQRRVTSDGPLDPVLLDDAMDEVAAILHTDGTETR